MHHALDALKQLHDVRHLIQAGGLTLVCAIVFVETGLFFGFFLPGDSLLVTAGIFARTGVVSLHWLLLLAAVCAIAGDQLGYIIGYKGGRALFVREDSFFFRKKHVERTQRFYEKYGAKTIVIARFVPIVRTFAPAVAGVAAMNYATFVTYNLVGGLAWVFSTVLGGYFLASAVPNIESRIHEVILVVVALSILPAAIEIWRETRKRGAKAG
jgi:membrane-associated protein